MNHVLNKDEILKNVTNKIEMAMYMTYRSQIFY